MPSKRIGKQTVKMLKPPSIVGYASVVGKKEGEGPLGGSFDYINEDTTFGEKTWEKSESRMQKEATERALKKAGLTYDKLDYIMAGDLINQCIASSFAARESEVPFVGLYGACSTMAEGLAMSSMLIDGGFSGLSAAVASSHYCTAERQYRTPLEYGAQRTPTAQWTVTGSGAVILSEEGPGPYITYATMGKIVDLGVKDANNMGAAMAPAAHDTLAAMFHDTGTSPADYDLIVTGDLGSVGYDIVLDFFKRDGISFNGNYKDCGMAIYDAEKQDVHAGGSGCGCSAVVLCGKLLNDMKAGKLKKIIFAGTGALLSPVSTMQGESIPCVCHAVCISADR